MATTYLPVRELPFAGESLTGLVRRHAVAMQYRSVGQLLSLMEGVRFPAHLDHTQRGPALASLARFVRRDEHVLRQMTAHRWTSRLMLQERGTESPDHCDSKTLLRFFDAARPRVCARCLAESPTLERLVWSFRPLGICAEHAELLVEQCTQCERRFSPSRLDLVRCQCGFNITEIPPNPVTGRAFELTHRIAAWLEGDESGPLELPTAAGFLWLDRLRSAVARASVWLELVKREWATPEPQTDESLA
ncbi:MAG TPA: TniQ family protein [Pirellulales bacterium]|jgi:hypothetical protein|nr:TniQ family protein [Pirellulales bacterium]